MKRSELTTTSAPYIAFGSPSWTKQMYTSYGLGTLTVATYVCLFHAFIRNGCIGSIQFSLRFSPTLGILSSAQQISHYQHHFFKFGAHFPPFYHLFLFVHFVCYLLGLPQGWAGNDGNLVDLTDQMQ
eukprot:1168831-Amphidinium_carterae.1